MDVVSMDVEPIADSAPIINTRCVIPSESILTFYKRTSSLPAEGQVFCCSICQKTFKYKSLVVRHVATHLDRNSRPYKCEFCDCSFTCKDRLKKHRIKHTGVVPRDCKFCPETFTHEDDFNEHMKLHSGLKKHFCKICSKRYKTKNSLSTHLKTHSEQKPFVCGIKFCQKAFLFANRLKRHQNQVHFSSTRHVCDLCNKSFSCKDTLNAHLKSHVSLDYMCDLCGKRFINISGVNRCSLKHLGHKFKRPNKHTCKICDKQFTSRSCLAKHVETHNLKREKPFTCDLCGKSVLTASNLVMHMKTHTRRTNYNCNICSKMFRTSSNLSAHMRRHSVKHFSCKVCNKAFFTPGDLQRHENIHTGETSYACPICMKLFNCLTNMIRHERYFHSEMKMFECKLCTRTFKSQYDLNRHKTSKLHKRTVEESAVDSSD